MEEEISRTTVGAYEYVISRNGEYWIICVDTTKNKHLTHGPFNEEQASEIVRSRIRREEALKR